MFYFFPHDNAVKSPDALLLLQKRHSPLDGAFFQVGGGGDTTLFIRWRAWMRPWQVWRHAILRVASATEESLEAQIIKLFFTQVGMVFDESLHKVRFCCPSEYVYKAFEPYSLRFYYELKNLLGINDLGFSLEVVSSREVELLQTNGSLPSPEFLATVSLQLQPGEVLGDSVSPSVACIALNNSKENVFSSMGTTSVATQSLSQPQKNTKNPFDNLNVTAACQLQADPYEGSDTPKGSLSQGKEDVSLNDQSLSGGCDSSMAHGSSNVSCVFSGLALLNASKRAATNKSESNASESDSASFAPKKRARRRTKAEMKAFRVQQRAQAFAKQAEENATQEFLDFFLSAVKEQIRQGRSVEDPNFCWDKVDLKFHQDIDLNSGEVVYKPCYCSQDKVTGLPCNFVGIPLTIHDLIALNIALTDLMRAEVFNATRSKSLADDCFGDVFDIAMVICAEELAGFFNTCVNFEAVNRYINKAQVAANSANKVEVLSQDQAQSSYAPYILQCVLARKKVAQKANYVAAINGRLTGTAASKAKAQKAKLSVDVELALKNLDALCKDKSRKKEEVTGFVVKDEARLAQEQQSNKTPAPEHNNQDLVLSGSAMQVSEVMEHPEQELVISNNSSKSQDEQAASIPVHTNEDKGFIAVYGKPQDISQEQLYKPLLADGFNDYAPSKAKNGPWKAPKSKRAPISFKLNNMFSQLDLAIRQTKTLKDMTRQAGDNQDIVASALVVAAKNPLVPAVLSGLENNNHNLSLFNESKLLEPQGFNGVANVQLGKAQKDCDKLDKSTSLDTPNNNSSAEINACFNKSASSFWQEKEHSHLVRFNLIKLIYQLNPPLIQAWFPVETEDKDAHVKAIMKAQVAADYAYKLNRWHSNMQGAFDNYDHAMVLEDAQQAAGDLLELSQEERLALLLAVSAKEEIKPNIFATNVVSILLRAKNIASAVVVKDDEELAPAKEPVLLLSYSAQPQSQSAQDETSVEASQEALNESSVSLDNEAALAASQKALEALEDLVAENISLPVDLWSEKDAEALFGDYVEDDYEGMDSLHTEPVHDIKTQMDSPEFEQDKSTLANNPDHASQDLNPQEPLVAPQVSEVASNMMTQEQENEVNPKSEAQDITSNEPVVLVSEENVTSQSQVAAEQDLNCQNSVEEEQHVAPVEPQASAQVEEEHTLIPAELQPPAAPYAPAYKNDAMEISPDEVEIQPAVQQALEDKAESAVEAVYEAEDVELKPEPVYSQVKLDVVNRLNELALIAKREGIKVEALSNVALKEQLPLRQATETVMECAKLLDTKIKEILDTEQDPPLSYIVALESWQDKIKESIEDLRAHKVYVASKSRAIGFLVRKVNEVRRHAHNTAEVPELPSYLEYKDMVKNRVITPVLAHAMVIFLQNALDRLCSLYPACQQVIYRDPLPVFVRYKNPDQSTAPEQAISMNQVQAGIMPPAQNQDMYQDQANGVASAQNQDMCQAQANGVAPAQNQDMCQAQANGVAPAQNQDMCQTQANGVASAQNQDMCQAQANGVASAQNQDMCQAQANGVAPAQNQDIQQAQTTAPTLPPGSRVAATLAKNATSHSAVSNNDGPHDSIYYLQKEEQDLARALYAATTPQAKEIARARLLEHLRLKDNARLLAQAKSDELENELENAASGADQELIDSVRQYQTFIRLDADLRQKIEQGEQLTQDERALLFEQAKLADQAVKTAQDGKGAEKFNLASRFSNEEVAAALRTLDKCRQSELDDTAIDNKADLQERGQRIINNVIRKAYQKKGKHITGNSSLPLPETFISTVSASPVHGDREICVRNKSPNKAASSAQLLEQAAALAKAHAQDSANDALVNAPVANQQGAPVAPAAPGAPVAPVVTAPSARAGLCPRNEVNPAKNFESFVADYVSIKVVSAALDVCNSINSRDYKFPLFIFGGPGVGKTHLLHSIYNRVQLTNPDMNIAYMRADEFVQHYVEMIADMQKVRFSDKQVFFKRAFTDNSLLLVDDLQDFVKAEKSRHAFFDMLDSFVDKPGHQLVIAGNLTSVLELSIKDELLTRISSGVSLELSPLRISRRRDFIDKLCADLQLDISQETAEFLSLNLGANMRDVESALRTIKSMVSTPGYETLTFDELILNINNLICNKTDILPLESILHFVTEEFRVTVDEMCSPSKKKHISLSRSVACCLARDYIPSMSLNDLAKVFKKDHSSIHEAILRTRARLVSDYELKIRVQRIAASLDKILGRAL